MEHVERAGRGIGQLAFEHGGDDLAGEVDGHSLADAIRAAGQAGVDEPAVGVVLAGFFPEAAWRKHEVGEA